MEKTFEIIRAYVLLYPILFELGLTCEKPLYLQFTAIPSIGKLANQLSRRPIILSGADGIPQIRKAISGANSQGIFFVPLSMPRPTYHDKEVINLLVSIARTGTVNEKRCRAVPFVIADMPLPQEMQPQFFQISCEWYTSNLELPFHKIPTDQELCVILDRIETLQNSGCQNPLSFAAQFLYPQGKYNPEWFHHLEETAEILFDLDINAKESNDLPVLFLSTLFDWQKKSQFCCLHILPNLESSELKEFSSSMYYDETKAWIFLSEILFREIIQPLTNSYSLSTIKSKLADEGILLRNESRHFTRQMPFYNIAGQLSHKRMICLDATKLSQLGSPDFVTICNILADGGNSDE